MSKEPELIALAAVYRDGAMVRSKISAPVVKALRVKGGDVLAFEQQADGAVVVRKSTAADRKSLVKSPASKERREGVRAVGSQATPERIQMWVRDAKTLLGMRWRAARAVAASCRPSRHQFQGRLPAAMQL